MLSNLNQKKSYLSDQGSQLPDKSTAQLRTEMKAMKVDIRDKIAVMRETKGFIEQGEDQVEMLTQYNIEADPGYYQTLVDEQRAEL